MSKQIYTEVLNHHFDEEDDVICIDGYKSDDENEGGTVIAWVTRTEKVLYKDVDARICTLAQEVIKDAKQQMRAMRGEDRPRQSQLEEQIVLDIIQHSDTTVLSELLSYLPDNIIEASLPE